MENVELTPGIHTQLLYEQAINLCVCVCVCVATDVLKFILYSIIT